MRTVVRVSVLAATLAVLSPGPAAAAPSPSAEPPPPGCDPIDTAHCLLPFPNDWFTVRDPRAATGRRVRFTPEAMPKNVSGVPVDPAEFNRNDGFSPGSPLLANIPGLDLEQTGAAPITDMARSLRPDAPIVLIDARTGKRQPYWAELDSNATDPDRRALIVRPARRLAEGARYVVALRNLRDASGAAIKPGPAFAAMLSHRPPSDPVLLRRWVSLRPAFAALRRAGVNPQELYLAWDFTTTSTRGLTERVLHMRDEAFGELDGSAPKVTISSVTDTTPEQDPLIARRITGQVEVPSYLDQPGGPPGSRLNYSSASPDALPARIPGNVQQAAFQCNIPHRAFDEPSRPVLFGHGLFGNETAVDGAAVAAAEHNVVFCGTAWIGMSSEDVPFLASVISDFSAFPAVPDRLQQSYLDFLFLGRMMIHPDGFPALPEFRDPAGEPLLDRSARLAYAGFSLGGIQGTALTALAQDYRNALLGVPAINFSTLLNRAAPFVVFQQLVDAAYPDRLEQQVLFAAAQMLWDRGEGDGYAAHVTRDPLPGTPVHRVLLHEAFGDHQVANVATEVEARTLGVRVHQPALAPGRSPDVTPFWDIDPIRRYPFRGSALIMWDSGAQPPPLGNVPPTVGHDPHGDTANTPAARRQAFHFLTTGEVIDVCDGAPCVAVPTG